MYSFQDKDKPLFHETYRNAIITPIKWLEKKFHFHSGLFDQAGSIVKSSLLWRNYGQISFPFEIGDLPIETSDKQPIYCGPLYDHFGHFLLESLSRLWITELYPNRPLAWSYDQNKVEAAYSSWQKEVLGLLGISAEAIFVNNPMRFSEVLLPQSGYRIRDYFHPEHAKFLAKARLRNSDASQKIWLSRSEFNNNQGTVTIKIFESQLEELGWKVLHPETLSISEQLDALSKACHIAGEEGSAFHLLILLSKTNNLKVDIFCRDPRRSPLEINENYNTIAKTKNFNQNIHSAKEEKILYTINNYVRKVPQNYKYYRRALGIQNYRAKPQRQQEMTYSIRRLNKIALMLEAKKYLEIGVQTGNTFSAISVPHKEAVDPNFLFDFENLDKDSERYFEMPSDRYFSNFTDKHTKFDLIFIDGLHTFEQTFRDFCATQAFSTDQTVWVIDDVVPNDVFSSIKEQEAALRFRKMAGMNSLAWHGDVFKTVYAIHDLFPTHDYRTINTNGNPQTVVIRKPRPGFNPIFNDLEKISRLTYFDLIDNPKAMRFATEEETYNWLEKNIS